MSCKCCQGNDDKALEDLQRNNSGDTLLVELKKILNFRHTAFKKLQETSNDMQKEIQRLRGEREHLKASALTCMLLSDSFAS